MHRKNPISVLVYNTLFPTPSPTDPPSFSAHLSKNLVGEVRIETANFYGSLDTIEARYPGLNYAFQPHRKRLGRFPHHKRLFEAFDKLGLTEAEIQGFCRWEGTLWARERYERDEGVKVVDTTGVEIGAWVDTRSHYSKSRPGINVKTDIEVEIEELQQQQQNSRSHQASNTTTTSSSARPTQGDTEMPDSPTTTTTTSHQQSDLETDSDSDADSTSSSSSAAHLPPSLSFSLNARLLHAAAASATGTSSSSSASNNSLPPMDPEWEQYLKEASERGELNIDATREALRNMAGQIAQLHQQSSSGVRNGGGVEVDASEVVGQQQQAFQPPAAPA